MCLGTGQGGQDKSSAITALSGGLLEAGGTYLAGRQARAAGRYNATILLQQARQARRQGQFAGQRIRQDAAAIGGRQRVAAASQGIDIGTGTTRQLQEETAALAEQDALRADEQGAQAAWGFASQAALTRLQGDLAYRGAVTRATSSLLGSAQAAKEAGLFG